MHNILNATSTLSEIYSASCTYFADHTHMIHLFSKGHPAYNCTNLHEQQSVIVRDSVQNRNHLSNKDFAFLTNLTIISLL